MEKKVKDIAKICCTMCEGYINGKCELKMFPCYTVTEFAYKFINAGYVKQEKPKKIKKS